LIHSGTIRGRKKDRRVTPSDITKKEKPATMAGGRPFFKGKQRKHAEKKKKGLFPEPERLREPLMTESGNPNEQGKKCLKKREGDFPSCEPV